MEQIYKGAAANDKTGTTARTAAQIINDNFAYLDNKITRKDGIVVSTGSTISGQDVTYNAFWQWIIDAIDYTNPVDVVMNFPFATTGYSRLDLVALTTSNTFVRIPGTESDSNPISPPLPDNMIQAGFVLVTDLLVGDPSAPVTGDAFVKKMESQDFIANYGATTVIDHIDLIDDRSSISLIGSATDVKSVQLSTTFIRPGKPFFFKNRTGHNVTLWHLAGTGNVKYFFPNGLDLIVKPNEVISFNTNANDSSSVRFEYVGGATAVTGAMTYKGSVVNYAALPSAGLSVGDVYNLSDTGHNYAWSGATWDDLGPAVDISGKEDVVNKSQNIEIDKTSTSKYASIKQLYDWTVAKFQSILVSGTNIKTINGNSILGTGNMTVGLKIYNVKDYGALGDGTTDDTVSIQNTINACNTGGGGTVYLPNGIYFINGALDSNSQSQIYFPLNSFSSSINLKTIKLLGETPPNQYSNPANATGANDHPDTGVIIKSNLLAVGNVIGSRYETVSWGDFNFLHVKMENISVRVRSMTSTTHVVPVTTAINMGKVAFFTAKYIEFCTTSKMTLCLEPANTCYGVVMPKNNNFAICNMRNFNSYGFYVTVDCYEHTSLDNFLIDVCVIGLNMNTVNHSINVTKGCIQRSRYNIKTQNSSYFYINHVSFEDDYLKAIPTPLWNKTLYDLYDVDGTSSGLIRFHLVRTNFGVDYSVMLRSMTNSKIKFVKINELTEYTGLTPTPPPLSAAMAYWKFEEATGDYADSSSNGKTATRVNGATSGAGKVGNAMLTLASSTQYANAGSTGLSYNGTAISFAGWFKLNTSAAAYQTLINKANNTVKEYNIYYTKSTNRLTFSIYNGVALAGPEVVITGVPENVWIFVYAQMVGNSIKMSINNGTTVTSTLTSAASVNTAVDLLIGCADPIGSAVNGGVDEFAIFNRALTISEIAYLYNNGAGNTIS
jgi:hypothetical protein